ncbi:hypothetical protein GPECTOR_6g705 [Gonium pectorale]|uniref:Uncharacterized protein n=1 Tax=Gonium pectorale TaxID=33097 RepID=A0A150GV79_GONPE|nr:hypothetical protein GPECTOR_6g705 [Gonium pectorale]|eukprot:KXZ53787.1 hypothetical protein GPECTOR_6g705 [Gonium pectorale]
MFVKNSDGSSLEIVRTGSAEFSVVNGAMVQRAGTAAPNTTANVLQTAAYMGTPQSLNSEIDIGELLELKYLLINGTGKAQLGLVVHGVARVPLEGSVHGTVLHIVTAAGTITLDSTVITFSTAIANIFAEAGFRVSGTRRALLGSYAVLGFFNTIKDLSAAGKPPSQPEPKLPSENFVMKLKIYEPCVIPDQPKTDRCTYVPPETAGSSGYAPPPPSPIAPSPPMLDPNSTQNGTEEDTQDLAGVELYKGSRYMTHHETTVSYNGKIRVMYDFPIYPLWQKIEVMSGTTVYSWQQNVLPVGSTNEVLPYFCGNYSAATTGAAGLNASSVLNYTYTGIDSVGDKLARNFELNVLQLSDKTGKTEVMRIDYWDSLDTYTPLRFEFTHKDIGTVMIDVVEIRAITASSPEAQSAMFVAPLVANVNASCPNDPSLPHLSSPFKARGAVVSADMPTGADATTGRRLIEQSVVLAHQWNQLDHEKGTGDWPQWALDVYGGAHPTKRTDAAVRRMLGDCGSKMTFGMDIEPCGFDYWGYQNGAFGLSVRCGGNVGPVEVEGSLELDTCDSKIKGCLTIGVGLPDDNWLVKKAGHGSRERLACPQIGIDLSIEFASACVGYNYKEKYFFIEASLILNLIIFKVELSMEMDFSSCCIWIASVNLEASVGVSFFNIWVTVGDIDIVTDVYLRGNPEKQDETENPTALNLATGWMSVADGYWGDWNKLSYPCSKFAYNADKGSMEVLGLPMNSYQLRMEAPQGGGDDTALNGISVGCMTGTANTLESGDG